MSSRKNALLGGVCAIVAAALIAAGARHVRQEPFTPRIERYLRPRLEIGRFASATKVDAGELRIIAEKASPGHREIVFFRLGPSTEMHLENVELSLAQSSRTIWSALAPQGQISSNRIDLSGGVELDRDGARSMATRVVVSLGSGELRVD